MIRYFPLTEMRYTCFGRGGNPYEDLGRETLRQRGIVPTENPWQCDLLVTDVWPLSRRSVLAQSKLCALLKPIFVFTAEPRYCKIFTKTVDPHWLSPPIHVMNLYTGDLHLTNYSFSSWAIVPPKLDIAALQASQSVRKARIATLMTYITDPSTRRTFLKDGRNLDLCALRQEIALAAHARNLVDIYGTGWRDNIAKGVKPAHWWDVKIDILKSYLFNLCMENTAYDHYCSEKIWDALHAGCLPIYYGKNNRIYDDFPRDSFLDVAEHSSVSELLDHVETMTREEYSDRLAKCIEVYNRFLETDSFEAQYKSSILSTANRVKTIVSGCERIQESREVPANK